MDQTFVLVQYQHRRHSSRFQLYSKDLELLMDAGRRLGHLAPDEASSATTYVMIELLKSSSSIIPGNLIIASNNNRTFDELYEFSCSALCTSDAAKSTEQIRLVVDLCMQQSALSTRLVQESICSLVDEVIRLVATPDSLSVPTTCSLEFIKQTCIANGYKCSDCRLNIQQCLVFIKIVAWRTPHVLLALKYDLMCILAVLLGASSVQLACSGRDALLAIASIDGATDLSISLETQEAKSKILAARFIWARLVELTLTPNPTHHTNSAYYIWARIISLNSGWFPPPHVFETMEYWKILQSGLATGSSEQRKSCLFILKLSLFHLDRDIGIDCFTFNFAEKNDYQAQYEKYSTIFETIVLGRYLKQAQDSLQDLTRLSTATSKIDPSWIVALITAALSHGMQDSIRNLIGMWTLRSAPDVLRSSIAVSLDFVGACFLPWATLGHHFTSSVKRITKTAITCQYGEELSSFLSHLLNSIPNDNHTIGLVKALLQYLISKAGHILSFARGYVLDGLLTGLESRGVVLDSEVLALIGSVSSMGGFHEIVGDLMTAQCMKLASLASPQVRNQM